MSLASDLRKALAARDKPDPRDMVAAALALQYAKTIDEHPGPDTLIALGPKLLAALGALGLTTASRTTGKAAPDDGPQQQQPSPLDELRERRQRRLEQRTAG